MWNFSPYNVHCGPSYKGKWTSMKEIRSGEGFAWGVSSLSAVDLVFMLRIPQRMCDGDLDFHGTWEHCGDMPQ